MKLTNDVKHVTTLAATVLGSCAVVYLIYNTLLHLRETGIFHPDIRKKRKNSFSKDGTDLNSLLQALDNDHIEKADLLFVLRNLSDQCAFSEVQGFIGEHGHLDKIATILSYPDEDVKTHAALLINNLSLNPRNQAILKHHIPSLVNILKYHSNDENSSLGLAVTQALTNLTTLDDSHASIIPHVDVLVHQLQLSNIVQVKLQTLKVFVNVSSNGKICENSYELAAQLLHAVEPFIQPTEDEQLVLRAVSCCANILTALHRRWQENKQPNVATPEFVSERLRNNLELLAGHRLQDIQLQAGRSLMALSTPVCARPAVSLDELDILDVLKI